VQYSQLYLYTVDDQSERIFLTVQGRVVLVSKSAGARSRLPTQTSGKKPAANCLQEDRNPLRQHHEPNIRGGGKTVHVVFKYLSRIQRWYFLKLIATGGLFRGIDSSGGPDSAMELIHRRNWFLMYENF
jgi:hypothetical protein